MPNGRPCRRRLFSSRRPAVGPLLSAVLLAAAGCQKLPLRSTEIESVATARPTTVVGLTTDPPPAPREVAPPSPAAPLPPAAATDAEVTPAGLADGTPAAVRRPGSITATGATPLLDAAVARAEGRPADSDTPTSAADPLELSVEGAPLNSKAKTDGPFDEPLAAPPLAEPEPAKELPPAKPAAPTVEIPTTPPAVPSAPGPVAKSIDPEKPIAPVTTTPRDEWADSLSRLQELARRRAGERGEAAEAWGIRGHVLDWLAGNGDDPRAGNARAWNRVLAALSAATSGESIDESALAHHLTGAVDTLETFAPLQVRVLSLCRKVEGYGQYEPLDAPTAHAGKPLLVYCELDGVRYENESDAFVSRLSSRVEIVPAAGGAPVWSHAFGMAEDRCRQRRRDYYAHYLVPVPATVAPGEYALRLTQTDLLSGKSVAASVDLRVSH